MIVMMKGMIGVNEVEVIHVMMRTVTILIQVGNVITMKIKVIADILA